MDHKEVSRIVAALAEAGREINETCNRIDARERTRRALIKGGRIVQGVLIVQNDPTNGTHLLNRLDSINALTLEIQRKKEDL